MEDNQLKVCPFCGELPEIDATIKEFNTRWVRVRCHNDDCFVVYTGNYLNDESAIKAWNTRAESRPQANTEAEEVTDPFTDKINTPVLQEILNAAYKFLESGKWINDEQWLVHYAHFREFKEALFPIPNSKSNRGNYDKFND